MIPTPQSKRASPFSTTRPDASDARDIFPWKDRELRLALVAAGLVLVLVVVKQIWTPVGSAGWPFDWLTYLPLHVLAVILLGGAARATRLSPSVSRSWRLFQLSELVMIGTALASATLGFVGSRAAVVIAENIAWLSYPPFIAGVLLFPVARRARTGVRNSQVLGIIVLMSALTLGFFFASEAVWRVEYKSVGDLSNLWSPVGDLASLSALAFLLLRGTLPVHRSALFVLTAGLLVSGSADLITSQMAIAGTYGESAPIDAAWYVSDLLVCVAGAYQIALERSASATGTGHSRALGAYRAIVYVGVLLGYAIILRAQAPLLGLPAGGLLVAAATLTGLLVILPTVAFRDTERSMRERRAQEARFAALVSESADFVLVVSRDGILSYATPSISRALGFSADALVGTPFVDFVEPNAAAAVLHALSPGAEGTAAGATADARWRLRRADGGWLTVDARVRDRCEDALIEGFVVNARDVTAQIALEEQVRHSQKMEAVGRLAGGIAHDFNNVLTVVRGSARLAMEHAPPASPLARELREIERASERAAALTRRLLAFGRTRELQLTRLDLNSLLSGMEPMLRRLVAKEIALVVRLSPAAAWVDADEGYFEQVVLNLALNARDAMPDGGTLIVSVERNADDQQVVLRVQDTGTGMSADVRAHLFEPFYTTKPLGAGSGLGLAMVAGIVRDFRGTVTVGTSEGDGTTFMITLPLREAGVITPSRAVRAVPHVRGSERMLVVDDDEAIRGALQLYFGNLGYQVRVAAHGRQALQIILENGPVDIVLTDLAMPDMNGRQLVRALVGGTSVPKIICMSGYAEEQTASEDLTRSLPFVQKPFSLDELGATVRSVLARG